MSTPAKQTLAHLNTYLLTHSGTDKALMLLQYLPLVLLPLLPSHNLVGPGGRPLPIKAMGLARVRLGLERLSAAVGDGRVLFRLFGLIPILQWLASIQARKRAAPLPSTHPAAKASSSTSLTSRLSTLLLPNENKTEEYMAWSMILYYPLEHIYYLTSKGILPISAKRNARIGIWSCRFWAAYVVLSLLSLFRRQQAMLADKAASSASKQTLNLQTLVDLSYLPLTAHWSLESGLWSSSFPTGIFGSLAALVQLQLGWDATVPPPSSTTPTPPPLTLSRRSGQKTTNDLLIEKFLRSGEKAEEQINMGEL